MDAEELDAVEARCRKAREILRQVENLQHAIQRLCVDQDVVALRLEIGRSEANESLIQFMDHTERWQRICWSEDFPELREEIEVAIVSLLELKKTGLQNQLAEL